MVAISQQPAGDAKRTVLKRVKLLPDGAQQVARTCKSNSKQYPKQNNRKEAEQTWKVRTRQNDIDL